MKGFLLLLVFSLAGLAGVLYWRQTLQAPRPPVATVSERAKDGKGKERRRRQRRGARRLARNEVRGGDVFVASAPGEAPVAEGTYAPAAPRPQERERAPLAPGGSSITEAAPSEVFGELSSPTAQPGGARGQIADEPAPIKLSAADLRIVWQGEDLSRAETLRMDFSNEAGGHELSQDEIDARFRSKEDAVLGCIQRARPDEYTYVPGRVSVRFRILRTGAVKGVQVEGPVILHKGGLLGCVRGVVNGLRFPASNAGQVVTYPFSLM